MIEVFKTNVMSEEQASRLVRQIHLKFKHYEANFDLEDCDRILRVNCRSGLPDAGGLMALLQEFGFVAEVLGDECRVLRR